MGTGTSGPPNKLVAYDLKGYTTAEDRADAISSFEEVFYQKYGVYPSQIVLDPTVNAVYLGAYENGR